MRRGVLFLCVANSARSQMAQAIARSLLPPGTTVYSAGSDPSRINPVAIEVLAEIGLDASWQHAKGLDAVPLDRVCLVVTLCAEEVCPPLPPGIRHVHMPLSDPARVTESPQASRDAFRAVRDELESRLPELLASQFRPA